MKRSLSMHPSQSQTAHRRLAGGLVALVLCTASTTGCREMAGKKKNKSPQAQASDKSKKSDKPKASDKPGAAKAGPASAQ